MSDPAIEPESELSYKALYERLWQEYLFVLRMVRDLLDERGKG